QGKETRMPRRPAVMAFVMATAMLALAGGDASAANPAQRCAALKRKAAGLAAKGFAVCDAKAVLRGVSVDLVCTARVRTAFARLWARAERKGGCATSGDQTVVGDRIDAHDANLQTRLGLSGPPSRCSSLKFRDAGRRGACRLSCSAKAAKTGLSLNDAVIARCTSRCSAKLFAIFARA